MENIDRIIIWESCSNSRCL